jgi:hypothetical protein
MSQARYAYKDIPLTHAEACVIYRNFISRARDRIDQMQDELEEARKKFYEVLKSPLPTTKRVQYTLMPEDEGYDGASVDFDPVAFQGDSTWLDDTDAKRYPVTI